MTIRYKCEQCGAVLKIKEELIGTEGKCPKCKSKFIVPDPKDIEEPPPAASTGTKKKAKTKSPKKEKPEEPQTAKAPPADDEEFDPTDILFATDDDDEAGVTESVGDRDAAADDEPEADVFDAFDDDDELTAPPPTTPEPQASEVPTSATAADLLARKSGKKTSDPKRNYESAMAAVSASVEESLRTTDDSAQKKKKLQPTLPNQGKDWQKQLLLTRILPGAAAVLLLCLLGYWMMMDGTDVPPLYYVSGTVMLDGRPISGATVEFYPVGEREEQVANSSGTTDSDGEYVLFYAEGYTGAVEGQFIVTINSDYDFIPPDYTDFPTEHIREVTGTSEFNFNLTSN